MSASNNVILRATALITAAVIFLGTPFMIREYRFMRMRAEQREMMSHWEVHRKPREKPPGVSTPTLKWKFDLGKISGYRSLIAAELSPAIADDGTIYAGGKGGLFALNPDGTKKWIYWPPGQVTVSPAIDEDGTIWITAIDGLHRVNSGGTGKQIVGYGQGQQVGVGFDGTIYMSASSTRDTKVLTVHPPDQIVTNFMYGEKFAFGPAGRIYSVYMYRALTLYDRDGTVQWISGGARPSGSDEPAIRKDGGIYVGAYDRLTLYDTLGSELWSVPAHVTTSPSVAEDGTVYFGTDDGYLYAVDRDGVIKWKFNASAPVSSTPAISQAGLVYIGCGDGTILAVNSDGHEVWEYAAEGEIYSPTIGPDGTVYVQSSEGYLYALDDGMNNGGLAGQWPKLGADLKNSARKPDDF